MEHSAHLVDILNEAGKIVGSKPRRHIDKAKDIFHCVYLFLITPEGELVLTKILARRDLPNLFTGSIGLPVATIRRTGETARQAARRMATRELFIDHAELHSLGQDFADWQGKKRLTSAFYLIGDPPQVYSKTDIGELFTVSPKELGRQLRASPEKFSPPLVTLWRQYSKRLPV